MLRRHAESLLATAVGVALTYGLATSTWSVSSQGLWQHGPAQLFMAAALYCVIRGERQGWFYAWSGLALGFMVASRQTTAVVAAALLLYVLRRLAA